MKIVFYGIMLTLLLVGCNKPEASTEQAWIKTIREGGVLDPYDSKYDSKAINSWIEKNLLKGKTTRQDVLTIFGEPGRTKSRLTGDLDRPYRDNDTVFQYFLWDDNGANSFYLVLHFDPEKDILIDWEYSGSVCGFCPHVFAYDGRWRLEGKLLAGCVGKEREGTDTLLLPRLHARGNSLFVKLSNFAPEIDYVNQVTLAAVPLNEQEELDISETGNLVVRRSLREQQIEFSADSNGVSEVEVTIDSKSETDVLVLEVRNSSAFEAEMRGVFLEGQQEHRKTSLTVDFGNGRSTEVLPVGTKFLRRVVAAIPPQTTRVSLQAAGNFWYTRRLWLGKQTEREYPITWKSPLNAQPLCLSQMEEAELEFPMHQQADNPTRRMAYALRIDGYYDFVKQHK